MRRIIGAEWLLIILLLLLAAGLRFIGITYGQPDPQYAPSTYPRQMLHYQTPMQPDEYEYVAIPFEMVLMRSLTPDYVNRGFMTTLDFVAFELTGSGNGLTHQSDRKGVDPREYAPFPLYVMGRVFSGLGGLLAVAATYAVARQLSGRFAGVVAASIAAVSLTLIQHAHYAKPSVISSGFTMLTIWACYLCLRHRQRHYARYFALASLFGGLAAASRFNAASVLLMVAMTGLIVFYAQQNWRVFRNLAVLSLLAPAAFLLAIPQIVLTFKAFLEHFIYAVDQYTAGVSVLFPVAKDYGLFLEYRYLVLFSLGLPATLLAVVGIYVAFRAWTDKKQSRDFALFTALLLIHLLIYSYVVLRTVRPDNAEQLTIPVIPQFALLAGIGAVWLYQRLPFSRRLMAPALLLMAISVPLSLSLPFIQQLTQPDTREQMQAWVYDHLPKESRIYLNGPYNVPLDPADYRTTQTFGGAEFKSPAELQKKKTDYMILSDAWYYGAVQRAREIMPADYLETTQNYLESLAELTVVFHIDRPQWAGYDWLGHTPSYWHNPGLTVYCLTAESCAAVQ